MVNPYQLEAAVLTAKNLLAAARIELELCFDVRGTEPLGLVRLELELTIARVVQYEVEVAVAEERLSARRRQDNEALS